jgi:hypothetical protein
MSTATKKSPALARQIKIHLGEAAYLNYKATGDHDAAALAAAKNGTPSPDVPDTAFGLFPKPGIFGDPNVAAHLFDNRKDADKWAEYAGMDVKPVTVPTDVPVIRGTSGYLDSFYLTVDARDKALIEKNSDWYVAGTAAVTELQDDAESLMYESYQEARAEARMEGFRGSFGRRCPTPRKRRVEIAARRQPKPAASGFKPGEKARIKRSYPGFRIQRYLQGATATIVKPRGSKYEVNIDPTTKGLPNGRDKGWRLPAELMEKI